MITNQQIEETGTFKILTEKTPFLRKILLKKQTTDSISRIVYQIEKLGMDYIKDKCYPERELKIAKEIIQNKKS